MAALRDQTRVGIRRRSVEHQLYALDKFSRIERLRKKFHICQPDAVGAANLRACVSGDEEAGQIGALALQFIREFTTVTARQRHISDYQFQTLQHAFASSNSLVVVSRFGYGKTCTHQSVAHDAPNGGLVVYKQD